MSLTVVTRHHQRTTFEYKDQHGLFSIEILWGFVDNHTNPVVRQAFFWSSKQPQPVTVTVNSKNHVYYV